jgi:UDP-N-acetylmuramoylalanine--D-glutamate ligase
MNGQPAINGTRSEAVGKTLIVGLGETGLSCARYLMRQGVPAAVTDSREQPPGLQRLRDELPDLALFLGGFQPQVFAAAERIIVSPGVALTEPLVAAALARGVPVLGDIELFARAVQAPVVAITGSNGKSTVTSLVAAMAARAGRRVAVGGNLGQPALDLLDEAAELYVLELSSFQLETTRSLRPLAAVVLNVSPDHMDRYPDLAAYAAAKAGIYAGARVAVVNRDDPLVAAMQPAAPRVIGFTLGSPGAADYGLGERANQTWLWRGDQPLLAAAELLIPGRHNLANALAALALGEAAGLPSESCLQALRAFPGLPHRSQLLAEKAGVRWYNDSKGTNVGACIAALEGLHGAGQAPSTLLIAGGDGKGADFAPLAPVAARCARAVILIGRDAPLIAAALDGKVPLFRAPDLGAAVQMAAEQARPGDRVLLSPACASFDMFRNYEERGERFAAAVEELPA